MKGKWKTRAMAFVMAFTMGMSSMIPSSVYAAAEQPETKVETETQVFEEHTEEKVRAEDIVKDVSDKEFRIETSMEGISYDPERESVLLSEIKDQDGGSFQPEKPAVYYAQYLVTPKDGSEPYMIGRTITLTDTEGLAHSESNGGEKQKEDTSSEEDSEQPLPVEITSSQPEDTPDVLAELERDIEEGNVMMFSAADGMGKSETVHLNKGRTIYYPDYLGNYLTCLFTVNGKLAYCLESHRASPPTGDYVADILESNKNLQKVLYYGYGGAGDITGSYLSGKSDDEKYVYTHLAASYAYCGDLAFTGCPYENLVNAGVIAYINHLFGMEEPPKGELSFSNANVTAVREGDIQKTPDITLNGDHRNKITIPVPQGVTGYNKSKGTNVSGGNLEVYGGDTFYLQAPLTVTGKWESGQLYGSVRESWKTLVLTSTGGNNQDIGAFISEKAAPVSFDIQWLNLARVKILKKDAETGNPLDGAVYGVYKNSTCTDQLLTIAMTGEDGISYSDYFDAALETVYVKEITAPNGYAINKTVYPVHVSAGSSVEVEAVDTPVKGKITVKKQDVDTGYFLSQGDAKLEGAVYGLFAKEDIQKPDGTGVLYKAGSLIQEKTFGKSGEIVFENVYLGAMYVKEIAAPEGYLLDETEYDATLIYEGQEKAIVVKALTVKEKVKKQAFQIIKISEDGDQTETDLVEGAEFTIYLVSNLSKVKDGTLKPGNGSEFTPEDFIGYDFTDEEVAVTYEDGKEIEVPVLVTDKKGYAKSVELPYGQYVVAETKTPENLKQVHPFLVTVNEDSREPQEWRVFDDRPFEFMLKIIKKDAETDHKVLNNSATYKIWDFEKKAYVEQMVYYPEKEKISEFSTNTYGYLILPEELKAGHYRIEEIQAPDGYVRQGYEEEPTKAIEIVINSDTPHQIDPDTGAYIVEVVQYNEAQTGHLTLQKVGEQLKTVKDENLLEKAKKFFVTLKDMVMGEVSVESGLEKKFIYEESGVEGAVFELHAKETIYTPDGAVDENGDRIIRYEKDALVATLTTDEDGKAEIGELPLGSYYLKETTAGDHFVLNPEQKEFTLSAEDDTVSVVYEGVTYKNERQKIQISVEKKDSVSKEALEGVVFGLYAGEDIKNMQGKVVVEKDTLLETKATDPEGKLTFDSDLWHGHYYVKEEQHLPGYLPNDEIWEIDATYEDQNLPAIFLEKEVENQPTESYFTKTDIVTGEPVEGAKLQILDEEGTVVREWITTKEEHLEYALPVGNYILHEELPPLEDGYVSAEDVSFEVKEDGTITKVEMKDDFSKVDISKTDITGDTELVGVKLQVLNSKEEVLDEWISDGTEHRIEYLPVGEELTLRETQTISGYTLAEDVKFTLEDTG
ncbi:SpaA isopeptide-forming pilin-related protein, partial [Mediterraneibacter gnavus]